MSASLRLALYAALFCACVACVILLKLAPFLIVLTFVAYLALPSARPRTLGFLVLGSAAFSLLGFMRFLVLEAVPGIVQGGNRATEDAAVSKLREILFAEDVLRRRADIDPDHDGIGSAAFLGELSGHDDPLTRRLKQPVLEHYPEPIETPTGPASSVGGYYMLVCLPKAGGGFTARPNEAVDEEAAERRFLAYAWPAADKRGLLDAFVIDEHERILFARSSGPEGNRERTGPERPPTCDDVLAPSTREAWQIWKGKLPRKSLPGDREP